MKKLTIYFLLFISFISYGQINFIDHSFDVINPQKPTAVDLDLDGDIDLIVAQYNPGELKWFENDGNQNFTKHIIPNGYSLSYTINVLDFDFDGDPDIIGFSLLQDQRAIALLENDGNQNFTRIELIPSQTAIDLIDVVDLDEDSLYDFVTVEYEGSDAILFWYKNNGGNSFQKIQIDQTLTDIFSSNIDEIYVVDVDGINGLDMVHIGQYDFHWYKNDGNQNFSKIVIDTDYGNTYSAPPIDFDDDGDLDVLISSSVLQRGIHWFENDGNGNFIRHTLAEDMQDYRHTAIFDVDNDNDKDILTYNGSVADPTISPGYYIYENDGNYNFSRTFHLDIDYFHSPITISDIDNDNDNDVILKNQNDHKIHWYENISTVSNQPKFGQPEVVSSSLNDLNWTTSTSFDADGNVTSSGISYYDELGIGIQSQTLDVLTGKIWASQLLKDNYGRPAFQTLGAPITNNLEFSYNPDFIKLSDGVTNYSISDFDSDIEEPAPVGNTINTLGWYYSDLNTDKEYQDVTLYPFLRTVYSEINPGAVLKSIGSNKVDADNDGQKEWVNGFSYTVPIVQELYYFYGKDFFNGNIYFSGEEVITKGTKDVFIDVRGYESIIFSDTEGKILATAKSGGATKYEVVSTIGEQGYVDVHIPIGISGSDIQFLTGDSYTIYDLRTEKVVTSMSGGNLYRISLSPQSNHRTYIDNNGQINVVLNPKGIRYKVNYHEISLNYYDESGRLLKTVQPMGFDETALTGIKASVSHNEHLTSKFEYNSTNETITSSEPDKGSTTYKYREDGKIRFSQNISQKEDGGIPNFSYINYDELGRSVESGIYTPVVPKIYPPPNYYDNLDPDVEELPWGTSSEQRFTVYDIKDTQALHAALLAAGIFGENTYPEQRFVAGNISKTYTENPKTSITWYSYDIYGRVEWMIQHIDGMGIATLDYTYDPITGNILEVDYDRYKPSERFVHRYTYNNAQQLVHVETSRPFFSNTFTTQARYEYNETRELKRVEVADNLQGVDYVYNLAGQLKAINHPSGNINNDPGKDGSNGFYPDVFSMGLHYYSGDYARTNTPTPVSSLEDGVDIFNNNIKAMSWKTNTVSTPNTETYYYEYNQNNWLESAHFGAPGTDSGDYSVSELNYDKNGNLLSLNRNKHTENGSNAMDEFTYNYKPNTNQLDYISDAVSQNTNAQDLKNQSSGNYEYNKIGQLRHNTEEDVYYVYNASGLVSSIHKDGQPLVRFYYDDRGFRVKKESYSNGVLSETDIYVRDASGNTVAVYDNWGDTEVRLEHSIYGLSRLGVHIYQPNPNQVVKEVYEFTDHLGNVRAVMERSNPTPTTTTDYYPFGMTMPGRTTIGSETYRYAFQGQEKDPETGKEAFQLRLWDSRIGRWLTTDPYNQYHSPYMGMDNTPNMSIDPDGGMTNCPDCDVNGGTLDEVIIVAKNDSGWTFPGPTAGYDLSALEIDIPDINRLKYYYLGQLYQQYSNFIRPEFANQKTGIIKPEFLNVFDYWAESENALGKFTYGIVNDASVAFQTFNPFDNQVTNLNGAGVYGQQAMDGLINTLSLFTPAARGTKGLGYIPKLNTAQFSKTFKGNLSRLTPKLRGYYNRQINKLIEQWNKNVAPSLSNGDAVKVIKSLGPKDDRSN